MTNSFRRTTVSLACALLMGVGSTVSAQAAKPAPAAATGKVAYNKAHFDFLLKMQKQRGAPDSPELKKMIEDELINRELLLREARKSGLDKEGDLKLQMELASQNLLINTFVGNWVKSNPVPDAELKKRYEEIKTTMGDKEYRARHILVKTEDEAKEIVSLLQKGGDFEKLAKERSQDPGSKERGGDLDYNTPNGFVKPFSEAMVKLEKGKYTAVPVKSEFGWHVIRLDDVRATQVPSFDEVKPRLQESMQQQTVQRMIGDLRAKAGV